MGYFLFGKYKPENFLYLVTSQIVYLDKMMKVTRKIEVLAGKTYTICEILYKIEHKYSAKLLVETIAWVLLYYVNIKFNIFRLGLMNQTIL